MQKEELEMSIEQPVSSIGLPNAAPSTSRRSFLAGAGGAAVALLGGRLTRLDNLLVGDALAADTGCPPATFAPLPAGALGPQLNAEGYFVGRISGDLYWVTD
ncbi:MAG: twin-arginine translocation signal domain-containing protein, partial [Chloroflexi bacterium]